MFDQPTGQAAGFLVVDGTVALHRCDHRRRDGAETSEMHHVPPGSVARSKSLCSAFSAVAASVPGTSTEMVMLESVLWTMGTPASLSARPARYMTPGVPRMPAPTIDILAQSRRIRSANGSGSSFAWGAARSLSLTIKNRPAALTFTPSRLLRGYESARRAY